VPQFTLNQRITLAIVPRLAALLIRALGATLRYENVFPSGTVNPIPGDEIPGPTVYAFWHRSLLVCAHRFRNQDIAILISHSFDGELIARTVEILGFRAVRGSSSRGGATGLRGMAEAYADGHICAFTADGPRGPAMIAKPGPAHLAQLVDAPWVGAFYALPLRAWTLKSWDRFLIPKPFSKVFVTFSAQVPTSTPDLQAAIQASLDQAVALAENAKRRTPHEVVAARD
jgi:lysophospholipid acyltransferase (LPLAT)-like uncharacterized protein